MKTYYALLNGARITSVLASSEADARTKLKTELTRNPRHRAFYDAWVKYGSQVGEG